MKVLVTGGAGFIGARVVDHLNRAGHEPIVLDHASGGDVTKPIDVDADHVIHLAGVLGTDELFDTPDHAIDVNVKGTLNVLRWCAARDAGYTDITMPPVFPSVYTATKICAAHFAQAWRQAYRIRASHVRAFNAFGSGQKHGHGHPRKIVPAFATEAWTDVPLQIWGNGEQTVDLVHVDDVARMLVDAIRFDGQTFDAGTGTAHTVNEVAAMVIGIVGEGTVAHRQMRRGETPTLIVAEGEGWDLLDWKPEFRYDELVDTVHWYRP